MATTLEIIQGLAQAASRAYDGAHVADYNDDGRERSAGLRREEGDPLIDRRVIDGFKVRFSGPTMILSYQSEIKLKEVYAGGFESDIDRQLNEIKKFLQKEYKVNVYRPEEEEEWATNHKKEAIKEQGPVAVVAHIGRSSEGMVCIIVEDALEK